MCILDVSYMLSKHKSNTALWEGHAPSATSYIHFTAKTTYNRQNLDLDVI